MIHTGQSMCLLIGSTEIAIFLLTLAFDRDLGAPAWRTLWNAVNEVKLVRSLCQTSGSAAFVIYIAHKTYITASTLPMLCSYQYMFLFWRPISECLAV